MVDLVCGGEATAEVVTLVTTGPRARIRPLLHMPPGWESPRGSYISVMRLEVPQEIVRQAALDRDDGRWTERARASGQRVYGGSWQPLLNEIASGHLPNPDTLGDAVLSLPDLPDQVGDHIRRKIKAKKQPARGGRPRGNPSADAEAFLNETLAIPPSVRMVVIGLLVGTIRRPRGRHRIDPADREFTRFAIQASLDFFVAGNSLPGRPPRSEFAGSDREWAIFETAHEHGRSEESVRDILGERKGWEDLRPEWSRKKG